MWASRGHRGSEINLWVFVYMLVQKRGGLLCILKNKRLNKHSVFLIFILFIYFSSAFAANQLCPPLTNTQLSPQTRSTLAGWLQAPSWLSIQVWWPDLLLWGAQMTERGAEGGSWLSCFPEILGRLDSPHTKETVGPQSSFASGEFVQHKLLSCVYLLLIASRIPVSRASRSRLSVVMCFLWFQSSSPKSLSCFFVWEKTFHRFQLPQ